MSEADGNASFAFFMFPLLLVDDFFITNVLTRGHGTPGFNVEYYSNNTKSSRILLRYKNSAKYMRRFHALQEIPPSIITSGSHNMPAFNVKKWRQT